jgi:ATP-binding cassette subfamily F protein 3
MERVEVEEEDTASMHFRFPPPQHSGKVVLTVKDAGKSYDTKKIFSHASFILEKGDRIAFVGRNGEGKTSMMKMIAGQTAFSGTLQLGHSVLMGYFEQDQAEKLDPEKTVYDTIEDLAVGEVRGRIRNLLGAFLFSGEDVDKKVKVLSGGERGRLALCKLLLQPYNLLLLDEPTNHLDIRSKEILKHALLDYQGTLIIVSHDRDFMDGLVTKIYEFREGHVKEHLCDINEFMRKRKLERLSELKTFGNPPPDKKEAQVKLPAGQNDESREPVSQEKRIKQIQKEIKKIEEEIEGLEKVKSASDKKINTPGFYETEDTTAFFKDYAGLKEKMDEKFKRWEDLSRQLTSLN